jgi:hypothetical protein
MVRKRIISAGAPLELGLVHQVVGPEALMARRWISPPS